MLESHVNISILLSEVHEPSALRSARLHLERAPLRAKQTELNEIGAQ